MSLEAGTKLNTVLPLAADAFAASISNVPVQTTGSDAVILGRKGFEAGALWALGVVAELGVLVANGGTGVTTGRDATVV